MNFNRRNIAIIGTSLILVFLLYTFSAIVGYIFVAWIVSMLGRPIMVWFQRKLQFQKFKAGSTLCASLTLTIIFSFFVLLIMLFVPLVVQQTGNLGGVNFAAIADELEAPFQEFQAFLGRYGLITKEESLETMMADSLNSLFREEEIGQFFSGALSISSGILIWLFSVLFISFFFLKEQGLFTNFLISIVPKQYAKQTVSAIEQITTLLSRYFGGILIQITIITVYLTFWLEVLSIENALLIAFFAALINVIPYLGPIIGAAFGAFIVIASNLDLDFYSQTMPLIVKVLAVFASMQLLDNLLLQPIIFSKSVMAHPLEIFIIILMGAQLGGITGMVLAIPIYTIMRVIARVFLSKFPLAMRLTQSMDQQERSAFEKGNRNQ